MIVFEFTAKEIDFAVKRTVKRGWKERRDSQHCDGKAVK
jgi:hypothetical protein